MRAWVWSEDGLVLEDVDDPHPKHGEVGVRVVACGLCQTDLHVMSGAVPFPKPCVLGHEMSGVVDEIGPGVTHLSVGDRITAGFVMPCGRCRKCARGHDDQCEAFLDLNRARGVLYDGTSRLRSERRGDIAMYSMAGLAQRCVLPALAAVLLPESLGFEEAAVLGCSGLTAIGAVQNVAHLRPGESAAIIGAGGVGLNVVQLAHLHGADPVIAVDLDREKLALARSLGATHTVDARTEDVATRLHGITGAGVDVCFDVVGTARSVADSTRGVDREGRVVLVGVGAGTAPVEVDVLTLVRRKLQLLGSFGGRTRQDLPRLVRYATLGRVDTAALISNRYRFEDLHQAVDDLEKGRVLGRAVISMR